MYWADTIGVAEVYRQIRAWHQQYGERWAPASLLRRLAETGTPLREAKPGRPTGRPRRQATAWRGYALGMARPLGLTRS